MKYLVGYTNTGYKLFDPRTNKVENVCNVIVQENDLFKGDFPAKETNLKNVSDLFENSNVVQNGEDNSAPSN